MGEETPCQESDGDGQGRASHGGPGNEPQITIGCPSLLMDPVEATKMRRKGVLHGPSLNSTFSSLMR